MPKFYSNKPKNLKTLPHLLEQPLKDSGFRIICKSWNDVKGHCHLSMSTMTDGIWLSVTVLKQPYYISCTVFEILQFVYCAWLPMTLNSRSIPLWQLIG